jgi:prepilin-type N-terminal cleavage/methylation domain-containing protein
MGCWENTVQLALHFYLQGEILMARITPPTKGAFTLIELLIVVAIIAILAAIAVPNFLEAQVRSKVSRAKSDLRTLGTAVEAYLVDNNQYPLHMLVEQTVDQSVDPWIPPASSPGSWNEFHFSRKVSLSLTTPISYISSYPLDPFYVYNAPLDINNANLGKNPNPVRAFYEYSNSKYASSDPTTIQVFQKAYGGYRIWSGGPDHVRRDIYLRTPATNSMRVYDPTNGTTSWGDIWRTQLNSDGSRPKVPGYVD